MAEIALKLLLIQSLLQLCDASDDRPL
eukprot:COSAG04_NODE_4701_length_1939_cov_1.893478_2_plen_26_part_01